MPIYRARFQTTMEVEVTLTGSSEDDAADHAWTIAEDFADRLPTQTGDNRITGVSVSFDGIGADQVDELEA